MTTPVTTPMTMPTVQKADELVIVRSDLIPEVDPAELAVVRFPAGWQPKRLPTGFATLILDEDETTVVCSVDELDAGALGDEPPLAAERGWRRLTFPGPLPWEIVGFLADVAARLAEAHVPFTSMSGFTTDHLLVRAAHVDLAVAVLSGRPTPPQRPGTNP